MSLTVIQIDALRPMLKRYTVSDGRGLFQPVGVTIGHDGALYVTDDGSRSNWRVTTPENSEPC